MKENEEEDYEEDEIYLVDENNFSEPTEILENKLWIGSIQAAKDQKSFEEIGFTGVLNCSSGIQNYFENSTIEYLNITVEDKIETNLKEVFEIAHKFINKHKKVLVHCLGGASRSVTIIISYLMKNEKLNLRESYKMIKRKRFIINPNIGFIKQLMKYEFELYSIQTINYEEYVTQFFIEDLQMKKSELRNYIKKSIQKIGEEDPNLLFLEILKLYSLMEIKK